MSKKKVVVSGAANGIGAAIAVQLLENGDFPVCIDIQSFKDSELERKINYKFKLEEDFTFIENDASDEEFFGRYFKDYGPVYGLVNNAGLLGNDMAHGGRTSAGFDRVVTAHAKTALVLTEAILPVMPSGSSIVNIGSIEIIMAAPDVVLYASAKGALYGMTVAYSTTLGPRNIRVNMVSPGSVNTEKNLSMFTDEKGKRIVRLFEGRTPLQRGVEPKEVADVVMFLLSSASSSITGQDIVADCGYIRALYDPSWV